MKKIIYTISTIKNDGPNKVLKAMIDGLQNKNDYDVTIVSFLDGNNKELIDYYLNLQVRVISLNLKSKLNILIKGKYLFKNICNEIKPDIIHSHGILPDIINIKTRSYPSKKFTTIHNNMYEDYICRFGKTKGNIYIAWHQFYLKKMNSCICCSKYVYNCMKNKMTNITWVQNSIYIKDVNEKKYQKSRKEIRKMLNVDETDLVYLYAGVLTERKNIRSLLSYFEKGLTKNEYLLILGDGPLKEELETKYNNPNIIFLGFVNNVFDYYSASDIYVSFSKSEGFSISILEALEYKNYLLISDIPSHKEIFEIDKNIYLGEYFSLDSFFEKKNTLVKQLTSASFNHDKLLKKHLNVFNMMDKYLDIYENN